MPAGTQVVVRRAVRRVNHLVAHPHGAVGIVTRTPAGRETACLAPFPDGFEASLERTELDVLKHFKALLGDAAAAAESHRERLLAMKREAAGAPRLRGGEPGADHARKQSAAGA